MHLQRNRNRKEKRKETEILKRQHEVEERF